MPIKSKRCELLQRSFSSYPINALRHNLIGAGSFGIFSIALTMMYVSESRVMIVWTQIENNRENRRVSLARRVWPV